ncbi:MAG: hypothetical protein ACM3X7_07885 [Solirubrobacterales bacterium]
MLVFIIMLFSLILAALIFKFIMKDLLKDYKFNGKHCKRIAVIICIFISIATSIGVSYSIKTGFEQYQTGIKSNSNESNPPLYDDMSITSKFKNELIIWTYTSCVLLGTAYFTNKNIKKETKAI